MSNEKKAEKKETPDIVRGRMPIAMVWLIRFAFEGSDSELANKFRTTPGKVNDIKKGRNFAYITADTKFGQEEIDKAKERAEKLLGEDKDAVLAKIAEMEVASEEETAALEIARKGSRKPRGKKAEADEGGEGGEGGEGEASEPGVGEAIADDDLEALLEG